MEESNIKLQRIGATVDEQNLWVKVKSALASLLCDHTESKSRPCPKCLEVIEPLARPIARFATRAAMTNRPDTVIGKWDGYAALGSSLDLLFKEAYAGQTQGTIALHRDHPAKAQVQSKQQAQTQGT